VAEKKAEEGKGEPHAMPRARTRGVSCTQRARGKSRFAVFPARPLKGEMEERGECGFVRDGNQTA